MKPYPIMPSRRSLSCRRGKIFDAIVIASLIGSVGCHDIRTTTQPLPADGEDLPILHQVTEIHSHEKRAMQLVVRDAATLAQIPLQDVSVDFNREMLLIVTLGSVSSDQYAVRIDRVWREGHKLKVSLLLQHPRRDAPIVMASPYCIAVLPRCDLNVQDFTPDPPRRQRAWGQSQPGG